LVITSRHKGHTVVLTWLCGSSPFHFEGITTITTYELRIIEEAIAQPHPSILGVAEPPIV
jgi:hypothetical protein